jgi:hypothetical protein
MPDSPDFGNELHHHLDLFLVPQLQNLSDRFFRTTKQRIPEINGYFQNAPSRQIML